MFVSTVSSLFPDGGSGGYIYIGYLGANPQNYSNSSTLLINSPILAQGGKGKGKQGSSGSGGRIVFDIDPQVLDPLSLMSASGGVQAQACQSGAAGTIFNVNQNKLIISGGYQAPLNAKTRIERTNPTAPSFHLLNELHVKNYAIATFKLQGDFNQTNITQHNVSNIVIENNGIIIAPPVNTSQITNYQIYLMAQQISLTSGQLITSQAVRTMINAGLVQVDSKSVMALGLRSHIVANDFSIQGEVKLNIQAQIQSRHLTQAQAIGDIPLDSYTRLSALIANNFTLDDNAKITSDYFVLYTQNYGSVGGVLQKTQQFNNCSNDSTAEVFSFVQDRHQLPLTEQTLLLNFETQFGSPPVPPNSQMLHQAISNVTVEYMMQHVQSNFTLTLMSLNTLDIGPNAQLTQNRIGVFAQNLNIQGTLNTTGLGCNAGEGQQPGGGFSDNCTASGGANGGKGGLAINYYTRKIFSKPYLYDSASIYEFDKYNDSMCQQNIPQPVNHYDSPIVSEGSGGGIAQNVKKGGQGGGVIWIQAQYLKMDGVLEANGNKALNNYGGGGAGGSIYIATDKFSGKGSMSVVGGDGLQGGGGGSGGRIKIFYFSWFDSKQYPQITEGVAMQYFIQGGWGYGNFTGQAGTIWSTPCAPGYHGVFCQPCAVGSYKTEMSNVDCLPCQNMPPEAQEHGFYIAKAWGNPLCPYECATHLTPYENNPRCLNDFDLFLQNMGGLQIFIIIIIATVFGIASVMYFLYFNQSFKGEGEVQITRMKKAFEELDFADKDIHQEICRQYLIGSNTKDQRWQLPQLPPISIRGRIYLDKYEEFVNKINASDRWTKCEILTYYLLCIVYPPLVPYYLKKQRKRHYHRFKRVFIVEADRLEFWRQMEDKLNIELRFTSSDDYSVAYVDFIDIKKTKDSYDGPNLPMTFILQGDGSFSYPYQLNPHEPLLKSISYFWENVKLWEMFINNLNSRLQCLQPNYFTFLFKIKLLSLVSFINRLSSKLFEHYGVKMNLWLFEVKKQDAMSESILDKIDREEEYFILTHEYLLKKPMLMRNLVDYWRQENMLNSNKIFKLALVFTRNEDNGGNFSSRNRDYLHNEMAFSSSQRLDNLRKRSGDGSPDSGRNHTPPQMRREIANKGDPGKYIQLMTGTIREIHVDPTRVKVMKNYKRDCKFWLKDILLFPVSLVKTLILRHSDVVKRFGISVVFYILMVVIDLILTAQIFVVIYIPTTGKSIEWDAWPFICFYPLASLLSPIMGLLSFMLCKPFFYRALAYMNAICLAGNIVVFIVLQIVDKNRSVFYQLNLYGLLFAAKLILSQLISLQVAYFRNPKYHLYQAKLNEAMASLEKTTTINNEEFHLSMNQQDVRDTSSVESTI